MHASLRIFMLHRVRRRHVDRCFDLALLRLLWGPDAELAAAMQQGHQIKHAVVVPIPPGRNRQVPQGLDELPRARRRRRKPGNGPGAPPSDWHPIPGPLLPK